MSSSRAVQRLAAAGAAGVLGFGLLAFGGSAAHGAPNHRQRAVKAPPGTVAGWQDITAVPHSSDAWAIASTGTGLDNDHFFEVRRHHGHWTRVKAPSLHGRYGALNALASAGKKVIWLGGETEQGHGSIQGVNAIWRWSGKKFVAAKLPATETGATSVSSISASSASNAWAVGNEIYTSGQSPELVALQWNGKTWTAVPTPVGLGVVSTSGPDNAWGTDGSNLVHWNGKAWAIDGTVPAGGQVFSIVTVSSKLAYAVGTYGTPDGYGNNLVLRFNGTTWSLAPLAKGSGHGELFDVTMHGTSAWAVGTHINASDVARPVILHSTGGVWKAQPTVGKGYSLRTIAASSAKSAYAIGSHTNGEIGSTTFFDVYNGHSWKGASSKF